MLDVFPQTRDGAGKFLEFARARGFRRNGGFQDKITWMKDGPSALLWPREHGAYGELLFPLATALLLGRPGIATWALCAIAVGGFLAHEGFVVLAGLRGDRARREDGPRARISLLCFGAVALGGGVAALPRLDEGMVWGTTLAILLSCLAMLVAWLGAERSLAGKLMAALVLSSWCVPVSLSGGLSVHTSVGLWSIWFAVFSLGTAAVESVMARSARRSPRLAQALCVAIALLAPCSVLAAATYRLMPPQAPWTLLPAVVVSLALIASPVPARHMRSIGWSIVAVSVMTLGWMLRVFASVM
jgi:hypothetical protein